MNVNGSARSLIEQWMPCGYIGVDIEPGPGVDSIVSAENLVREFGSNSFDMLVSSEMVEHIPDWRRVVSEMKQVTRPGGCIMLTTRSRGFPLHTYPYDFWRYEVNDLRIIFSDFQIERLEVDGESPGVFIKARKPDSFAEVDLTGYDLFSILRHRPAARVTPFEMVAIKTATLVWDRTTGRLPRWATERLKRLIHR
jgi:SAM-dependent methyltransferase